jgi:uncharacterized membrane protein YphA (DoxX/SURF4 family)
MNMFTSSASSLDSKPGIAFGLIRIFLGIALAIRGYLILTNPDSIVELGVEQELFVWVSLVGITHLFGGVLLAIGFLTRLGAFIQIPILFSAIFFVYSHTKLMMGGQSIELAILVLFLLCVFFVFGAGSLSVKDFMTNKKK